MKLLVVIVNYKITDLTIDCLRSLADEKHRAPGTKVAVVENGTGPEHAERIRREIEANGWGSWCELTAISPNRGFTGGNNVVIRPALASADPPEYVFLLNADTIVPEGQIRALVEWMDRHPNVGISGTRLQFPDGEVQGTPFHFAGITAELDRGLQSKALHRLIHPWAVAVYPKPQAARRVDWVAGASMMIRRPVFDAIGLLDEDFFTYFDDIDFCHSALKAGFETWYVPETYIIHLEGRSTGISNAQVSPRAAYWFEARRRYFLKHHGAAYAAAADAAFIVGFSLRKVRERLLRQPDPDPPNMLSESIRQSVFVKGFEVNSVVNPAMPKRDGRG